MSIKREREVIEGIFSLISIGLTELLSFVVR